MGVGHYENFPVASVLLPRALRAPVREIYRFARHADDIADEGDAPGAERLAQLAALHRDLEAIAAGAYPAQGPWSALAATVHSHRLPVAALHDLLSAFEQDVRVSAYHDYDELLDYCRRSADPVGRLLLALYGRDDDPVLLRAADAVCTGLQLVNFWQDVDVDWRKGRVYVPQSELARHGVPLQQIGRRDTGGGWTALMRALTAHARDRLLAGGALPAALGGRIGWELRMIIQGGLRIAERIDAVHGDVFERRPRLRPWDWSVMAVRALRMP